ncbi:DUF748 domain-containing protein [Thioalkalivibrio sp. XN279]|uniref:DUF748 domain-containing protein n=1 Tax=Thioalkalivibrio sp. XN279 TaxID=2714953 RepID=UPI00140930CC|nr:DUF748 domain-containing protein [Thioalkalivibrio sp. XN279]NHA14042.1 DUF748 domain-containing protein [Thioalkalivibrio sp. XN279]
MTAAWRSKMKLQGWRLWALAAVLAYTLVGFLFLPWLAHNQAPKLAQERLGVDLSIEKVRFNPYLFKLTVEGLSLEDPESGPMLDFRRLVVDFSLSSAWRRAWTFGELALEHPQLRLQRGADGIVNFKRMFDRLPPPAEPAEPDPDAAPPRLVLHNVTLVEGRLAVADEAHPENWSLAFGPVSFAMEHFATLPEGEGAYTLEVTGPRGGRMRWNGSFAVDPLASAGSVELDNLALAPFWEYVRHDYDAAFTGEARLALGFDYALDGSSEALDLRVQRGRATLTGLEVAQRSSGAPLLALPRTAADGIEFDLAQGTLDVGSVELSQPGLELRQLEDGTIDLVAALTPPGSAAEEATEDAEGPEAESGDGEAAASGLAIRLGALRIDGGRVAFEDRMAPRPVQVALEDLVLAVTDYRSADGHRADVELNAAAASGGTLAVSGAVRALPLQVGLDVGIEGLSLLPALPYTDGAMNLEVASLLADAAGRITLSDEEPFAFTGKAALRALESRLPDEETQLVGWQVLDAEGIDLSLAGRALRIGKVAVSEPFLKVLVNEDGDLNLTAIAPGSTAGEAAPDAGAPDAGAPDAEAPDAGAAAEPFAVGVGRVDIADGTMDFTDLSLPIPFAALVQPMRGSIAAITSGSPTPARVEFDGDVNEYGAATIRGTLDVFEPTRVMELELDFRNIEMRDLTPYTVKFAGREIAAGTIDVDLSWIIRDGQLEARNRMLINDLKLGDKVDSPGAMSLPLDLAVALLTDTQGRIDLEVPVSGDITDPQFRYAPLVFRALGNVLGKIVTAPFRFLASLLGGGAEEADLEFVGFVAGDVTLRGPEAEDLSKLAEALVQRPELQLEIGAAFDEARDGRAIRQRLLDDAISARFEAGEGSGKDGDPVRLIMEAMYAEAAGAEAPATLQAEHSSIPEGSDKPVLDETAYIEALRAALLELQTVEAQEFRLLGMERAASVRNYLVESGGLDAARIAVAEPDEAPRADENLVFLQLELGVGQ